MISLICLLTLVAVPSYISHRTRTQATCITKKFRTYAMAFQAYAEQKGTWPPDQQTGEFPMGMESLLPEFNRETVVGGQWHWENPGDKQPPSLSLVNPRASPKVYARIDRILDNGDLNTGCMVYNGNKITLLLVP